jgi:cation diffusion facilitator family transporter
MGKGQTMVEPVRKPRSTLHAATLLGLASSVLLAVVKLVAGWVGHSTALVADAVESFADALGSVLVWHALRVAERPPNDAYPYGYGKAEAVAAFTVGLMLVLAALVIVGESVHEMLVPHQPPAAWTLAVLVTVILVKELLFRMMAHQAEQFRSDAAKADAWHHRSDAVTSVAALIGVSVAIWGPPWTGIEQLVLADEVAAILASGVIAMTAYRLIAPALLELLDALALEMVPRVKAIASQGDGVLEAEKIFVRKSGTGYHVDLHLHVDPELPVRDAHAVAGKVKSQLLSALPEVTAVLIHIEPGQQPTPGAAGR